MSFARDTHSLMLQAQYMQKGMWREKVEQAKTACPWIIS